MNHPTEDSPTRTTRRQFLGTAAAAGLTTLGGPGLARAQQSGGKRKQALAILGDAWHCVAPLYSSIVKPLKTRGYQPTTIIDYDVPFDELSAYDLIVLSRYAFEDATHYRGRDQPGAPRRPSLWLTADQEQKFEDYVNAGGRLLLHHDGIGFYPKDGAISRVARAFFVNHPPIVDIEIKATGKMPALTAGVEPFTVTEEEFKVEMDESQTSVFLESHSPEHGRAPQAWAHPYGQGKVTVFIPGHSREVLEHPMVSRSLENVIDWLSE